MNATEALAEKGLQVINGDHRLNAFLEVGGAVMLIDAAQGKTWEMSLKDGHASIAESTRDPRTPGFVSVMVNSKYNDKIAMISPKDITQNPINHRTVRREDDSPSP